MNKKRVLLLLILSISIAAIFAAAVSAAPQGAFLDEFLATFGGNFEKTYEKYDVFIDMCIYLVLFIGLAYFTLGKKMGGTFSTKGGKTVMVGIGIIFAVGLALFEKQAGFNIMAFGPIAMAILIVMIAFALYEGLDAFGAEQSTALEVSYLAALLALSAAGVLSWASKTKSSLVKMGVMGAGLVALVFGVLLGVKIIGKISDVFTGGKKGGGDGDAGGNGKAPPAPGDKKKAEKELGREEKAEEREFAEMNEIAKEIDGIMREVSDISKRPAAEQEAAKDGIRSKVKEVRTKQLPRLNKLNKRSEKEAKRIEKELMTAGAELQVEGKDAIRGFDEARKVIAGMEVLCAEAEHAIAAEPPNYTETMKQLRFLIDDMQLCAKRVENVYLIDERLKKEVEGKT